MKRRVVGAALILPLAAVMPSVVKSCHRGGDVRNASGGLVDNLLTIAFLLAIPMALVGLSMLFGNKQS